MSTYLQNQIAEGEEKLAELEREIAQHKQQIDRWISAMQARINEKSIVLARIEAYRDAMQHVADATAEKPKKRRPASSGRAISEQWQKVLAYLVSQFPETVTGTQLYKFCEAQDFDVREDTIRAQMAGFVNKGYAERTEPGQFRVSKDQARIAGVSPEILDWANRLFAPANVEGSGDDPEPSNHLGPVGRERGYPPSAPEGSTPSGSTESQDRREAYKRFIKDPNDDSEIPF